MTRKLMLACALMSIGIFLVGGMALAAGFRGTSGPDEISGTDRKDTIRGPGGNDRLSGRGGGDEIYGNGGRDRINGNDRIMADDTSVDVIRCGSGTDYVYANIDDTVYYGCETVKR